MQEGDNPARITRERQQKQIITATIGFLNGFSAPPCPAELLYGQNSREVMILKQFRDTVLKKTAAGQQIINLYYALSPTITKILMQNGSLRIEAQKVIDAIYPWPVEEAP